MIDEELLARLASVTYEPVMRPVSEDEERAFAKIQRLACVRERCTKELVERLARDGFPQECIMPAVDRAVACGLVDDMRYAGVLIRSRISQGKGIQGVADELGRMGIDVNQVPGWPDEFLDEVPAELDRALALLRRKPPRAKDVRAAAFRRLVGKGFSQQVAYDAARRYIEETLG